MVASDTRIILVEGNYLLLDEAPWTKLDGAFDFSVFINPGIEELERRLLKRWHDHGYDEDAARRKALGNDIPNAHRVVDHQRSADFVLADF
ncbi:nucleoside triphosphate hydrolase domain-containing protein [compost metagenome]